MGCGVWPWEVYLASFFLPDALPCFLFPPRDEWLCSLTHSTMMFFISMGPGTTELGDHEPKPLKSGAKTGILSHLGQVFCHSDDKPTNTCSPVCFRVDGCWVASGWGLKGEQPTSGGLQIQAVPCRLSSQALTAQCWGLTAPHWDLPAPQGVLRQCISSS